MRSVFGRALRLSTRAAGKAFLQTYYTRYSGQQLQRRLEISQADLTEPVGAANKSIVYQWESPVHHAFR